MKDPAQTIGDNPRKTPKAIARTQLCLALCLIFAVCMFFCIIKGNIFFVDEVWSYGLANSQYAPWVSTIQDGLIDKVFTRQDLFGYVTVDASDAFDYASVYFNQTQDNHPPLFYWMLHTVSSLFPNTFSKWIGLVPNLCIYLLTLLLLYLLVVRLFHDPKNGVITVLLYGLSTIGISSMLMIRMYMLMTLFGILLAYLIVCLLQTEKWYFYPAILATIFAGAMTQYYYVFYAFFVCAATDILLLTKKKWRVLTLFSVFALGGILLMYISFPTSLTRLLYSGKVTGNGIMENLLHPGTTVKHILSLVKRMIVVVITACVGFAVWIYQWASKHKKATGWYRSDVAVIILPAYISVLLIIIASSDTYGVRYLYYVCPMITLTASYAISLVDKDLLSAKIRRAAVICITVAAMVAVFLVKPEWIDTDKDHYTEFATQHSSAACVYIVKDETNDDVVTVDIPQLLSFSEVFVTDSAEQIPQYLATKDSPDELVLYVSCRMDYYHDAEQVNRIAESLGYGDCMLIHSYNGSDLYLLANPN